MILLAKSAKARFGGFFYARKVFDNPTNPLRRVFFGLPQRGSIVDAETTHDPLAEEALINQARLKELAGGVSSMTLWRWRQAGILPEPTSIRGRNYWRARDAVAALRRLTAGEAA